MKLTRLRITGGFEGLESLDEEFGPGLTNLVMLILRLSSGFSQRGSGLFPRSLLPLAQYGGNYG